MSVYYHVTKKWDGQDLESLYDQYGDEAYDIYAEKWPEAGNLAQVHAHVIHLHKTKNDAIDFANNFGGQILEISAEDFEIVIDDYEYAHPVCKHTIPADAVKVVA